MGAAACAHWGARYVPCEAKCRDKSETQNIKANNFDPARQGYFHYVLMVHQYEAPGYSPNSSGNAEIGGDDLVVAPHCWGTDDRDVAHTIMHELGHNLGLLHGGFENRNRKPNYNSVMNYRYQFPGVDTDCDGYGNRVLDYSNHANAVLDESSLDENAGICDGMPIDWDGDGNIDDSVSVDINDDGWTTELADYDDWANLGYALPQIEAFSDSSQDTVCENWPGR